MVTIKVLLWIFLCLLNDMLPLCRYAANVERNPEDHDALYNWALVLQVKMFTRWLSK